MTSHYKKPLPCIKDMVKNERSQRDCKGHADIILGHLSILRINKKQQEYDNLRYVSHWIFDKAWYVGCMLEHVQVCAGRAHKGKRQEPHE